MPKTKPSTKRTPEGPVHIPFGDDATNGTDLDQSDWTDLTENVFGPLGYVQEVLREQSELFRVFSTNDEEMFAFRAKNAPWLIHAASKIAGAWTCGCGAKPCIATALLDARDAIQPFLAGRR
jgi:hypothetical protein